MKKYHAWLFVMCFVLLVVAHFTINTRKFVGKVTQITNGMIEDFNTKGMSHNYDAMCFKLDSSDRDFRVIANKADAPDVAVGDKVQITEYLIFPEIMNNIEKL